MAAKSRSESPRRISHSSKAKVFQRPIVTQVVPLKAFYPAEAYHQDYAALHPNNPYIVYNDAPKVAHLREQLAICDFGWIVRKLHRLRMTGLAGADQFVFCSPR